MSAPLLPGRIEHWPLARLKPYARNAKTHDAGQVVKIAASMAEFGWTVPVVVAADGELIAGHGRILAAAQLGLSEAPVIVLGHLTEAQRRAYRIADNKLTELGGWDEALMLQELQALLAEDFDLGLIGIPEDELDALLRAGDEDRTVIDDDAADAIPDPPAETITKPGDIWALGKHRLCCGDATDADAVARLMQGERATLMFTSPPYAQQRDYGAAKEKVGDWDALMQGVFATGQNGRATAGQSRPRASRQRMAALLGRMGGMDARLWLATVWLVCLGSGPRFAGRLERPPGPVARVNFPLQPRAPQTAQDRPVQARGRNPRRRWAARGRRDRPRQDRHRQRDPKPSHSRQRVQDHAPQGRAGRGRIAPGGLPCGAGRGRADSVLGSG